MTKAMEAGEVVANLGHSGRIRVDGGTEEVMFNDTSVYPPGWWPDIGERVRFRRDPDYPDFAVRVRRPEREADA